MTAANPSEIKSALRRDALRRRSSAHGRLGTSAADVIKDLGLPLIAGLAGHCVSGYLPIRDELDPTALLAALGAQGRPLALPVIETKWAPLLFRAWTPGDLLAPAEFGLQVPVATAALWLPDILLVPLAAFDSSGYRIGYGGGYYDRTLALYRSMRSVAAIGIAYDEQDVPSFPHQPHDQRLDYLLTPTGVLTFGA